MCFTLLYGLPAGFSIIHTQVPLPNARPPCVHKLRRVVTYVDGSCPRKESYKINDRPTGTFIYSVTDLEPPPTPAFVSTPQGHHGDERRPDLNPY